MKTKTKSKSEVPMHDQTAYRPAIPVHTDPRPRLIVFSGLPGVGKTTLAQELARKLKAVHINADQVRHTINSRLGFTKNDRLCQADSLGHMCRWVADSGNYVVVDFVCPDFDTREAFLLATMEHRTQSIWFEVTKPGFVSRYEDTNRVYEPMHNSPFLDLLKIGKFVHLVNADTVESLVNFTHEHVIHGL